MLQANLLKFKELIGKLDDESAERWDDIKRTFQRNLMLGSAGKDDQLGQVIAQMTTFSDGLLQIRKSLDSGIGQMASSNEDGAETMQAETMQAVAMREIGHAVAELAKFNGKMDTIGEAITSLVKTTRRGIKEQKSIDHKIQVVNKVPHAFLDVLRNQFRIMQTWMEPILQVAEQIPEAEGLKKAALSTEANYEKLMGKIEKFKDENDDLFEDGE